MADKTDKAGGSDHSAKTEVDLKDPSLLLNRDLSWLEFNRRVLEEAEEKSTPVQEKLKFLSIFSSNLDEFFMVRVGAHARMLQAGLVEQVIAGGKRPKEQIEAVNAKTADYVKAQYRCLNETVLPGLKAAGAELCAMTSLDKKEVSTLNSYFESQVYPVLTPLAVDAGHPFPFLGNLKLNLMIMFKEIDSTAGVQPFAFIEVPSVLPRLVPIPGSDSLRWVLLEDLISANMGSLFPGMTISKVIPLRVTRNRDYNLHDEVVLDLLKSVEAELKDRSDKIAVRLEIAEGASKKALKILTSQLDIRESSVFHIQGPINICSLLPLAELDLGPEHRDPPFNPRIPRRLAGVKDIFALIREGDVLLHHPYDSFAPVIDFIASAAEDPDVLAIKQTLYRVDRNSPIVEALCRAAENGKQVTAVVELKARFDEERNIDFAYQMEKAGVNSVFGFVEWKTHCKASLVVRREGKNLRRYVHLGTGNYNSVTARIYTDLGLFTADPVIGSDVSNLFNVLTGFNSWTGGDMFKPELVESRFKKLMLAPVNLKERIVQLIEREIAKTTPKNPGRIIAKMNALVDARVIRALYKASMAGVKIDLICRGICNLIPGLPGISENIRVISILDRFLEHTRIYYFHNGGEPEIYSGSADWMPRNFDRRAEILFPIENLEIKGRIFNEILVTCLSDNVKARIMRPDGTYRRIEPGPDEKPLRSQFRFIEIARALGVKSPPQNGAALPGPKKKGKKR